MREPDFQSDSLVVFGFVSLHLNPAVRRGGPFRIAPISTLASAKALRDDLAAAIEWYERRKDAAE